MKRVSESILYGFEVIGVDERPDLFLRLGIKRCFGPGLRGFECALFKCRHVFNLLITVVEMNRGQSPSTGTFLPTGEIKRFQAISHVASMPAARVRPYLARSDRFPF